MRKKGCESDVIKECFERIKIDTDKPLATRQDGRVIVGILGGSFADAIARSGGKTMERLLRKTPEYKNRDVIIYNLAHGGYMQPQGLMHLAYFYSLGAEFDLVINVDGFNEISGTFFNYLDRKVHPSFPAYWDHKVAKTISGEFLDLYSDKRNALRDRANLAELGLIEGIRHSPLFNLYWRIREPLYIAKISQIDQAVATMEKRDEHGSSYEAKGPDFNFTDWADFFDYAAKIWADSSISIKAMVEGRGARYLHFLQPNQYIEGNKILSDFERKHTIVVDGGYGPVYRKYRPHLIKQIPRMKLQGVEFYDLTFAMADKSATLYVDNCCHMNARGYKLVVANIIDRIRNKPKGLSAAQLP